MSQSLTLTKNNKNYNLTQHSLERLQQRTNLTISQLQLSFQYSKTINHQNINQYPQFKTSFYNKQSSFLQSNTILLYNPKTKIQFRIDTFNNNICTIIQF